MTTRYVELAREGKLEELAAVVRATGGRNADRDLYKWLVLAEDFGHEDAGDDASDVLEHTSMRYDDSGWERAAAHWELAVAYLEATDGIDHDLELASHHLDEAFERRPGRERLAAINQGTGESYGADAVLARLRGEARDLLERKLGWDPLAEVHYRLERVERLIELSAPEVIVQTEIETLREAVDASVIPEELEERVREALEGS